MSDEHDSWFKDAFGVDLGDVANKVKEEASAVIAQAQNTVTQAVQTVGGAVESAVDGAVGAVGGVVGAAAGAVKKAASAAGVPGVGPAPAEGGGTGSFPLGGSVGRGGKNAPNDVRAVQSALGLGADGQCGPQTIAAIETYQRTMGQAKPDGRVDAGGATERAMSSGAAPAAVPSAPAPAAGEGDSGGLFDQVKKGAEGLLDGAKDLGGKVVSGAEGLLEDAKDLGGKAIAGAGGLLEDAKQLGGSLLSPGDGPDGESPALASTSAGGGIVGKISGFLSGSGTEFEKEIAIPVKKIPALNGKIKIDIALKLVVSGKVAIDDKDTTKLDSSALAVKAGNWWVVNKGDPELAKSDGLWTNLKMLKQDKLSLVAETSATTAIGKISLKITWAGIEKKLEKDALRFEPKVLEAEGALDGITVVVGNQEIEGLKFMDLKVTVGGSVTVGPEWKKILADLLKDKLRDQFLKYAEEAALSIGADVIIAGSFIVVGVATIAGACYQIAFGFELKDLTESYAGNLKSLERGFRAGMAGTAAPGDRYGVQGHALGQDNLTKLIERTKGQNPAATDDQIKAAVQAKADEATQEAINSGMVEAKLKNGMWDGLLNSGKWLFTAQDAATAFQACGLGNDPRFDSQSAKSTQWQAYLTKYPTQSKL